MSRIRGNLFRTVSLLGLAASTAALIDTQRDEPLFCNAQACLEAQAGPLAAPAGVPLAAVGVAAFASFFLVTLIPSRTAARAVGPAALLAGAVGAGLLVEQVAAGLLCRLCFVADTAGVFLAAVAVGLPRRPEETHHTARPAVWLSLAALAVVGPVAFAAARPQPTPPPAVRERLKSGHSDIVAVTDVTCHFCNQAHQALKQNRGARVEYIIVPVTGHPDGRAASRAHLAAADQGRGNEMAEALFANADRTPAGCRAAAKRLGLDMGRYDAFLRRPGLDRAIDRLRDEALGEIKAVPQTWVGSRLLKGHRPPAEVRNALARAAR